RRPRSAVRAACRSLDELQRARAVGADLEHRTVPRDRELQVALDALRLLGALDEDTHRDRPRGSSDRDDPPERRGAEVLVVGVRVGVARELEPDERVVRFDAQAAGARVVGPAGSLLLGDALRIDALRERQHQAGEPVLDPRGRALGVRIVVVARQTDADRDAVERDEQDDEDEQQLRVHRSIRPVRILPAWTCTDGDFLTASSRRSLKTRVSNSFEPTYASYPTF